MNSPIINKCINVLRIIIFCGICCIGIWEATVASTNQNMNSFKPNQVKAYIFTIINSIVNIIIGVVGSCLICITTNDDSSKTNTDTQLSCIKTGLGIWMFIMFAEMLTNSEKYEHFRDVILVEFIIVMIGLSISVFTIIITCCACCILPFMVNNKAEIKTNINILNENHQTDIENK